MAMTRQQAEKIWQEYKLNVRAIPGEGFVAERQTPGRLHRDIKPSMEEAIEAAYESLQATDIRLDGQRAQKAIAALQKGRFYFVPRRDAVRGRVFDGVLADGSPTEVIGRENYQAAVLDLEALLG